MNDYVVISHDAWTPGGYVEGLFDTEEAAVQKSAEVKRTTPNAAVSIYKLLGNIEVQKIERVIVHRTDAPADVKDLVTG